MQGRYCYDCGARPFTADDYTVRRFLRSAFHEITDLDDSKLYRTLHALFLKPGLLTHEYFSARRVRYVKPLALLLSVFALHIFVYSVSNTVNLFSLDVSINASPFQGQAGSMSEILGKAADRRGIPLAELKANINERWTSNFSWTQLPQVLVFALLLKLIFLFGRRRFVEHLVFAAHFYAFQVLTVILMWPIYWMVGIKLSAAGATVAIAKFLIDVTYVYFAARRFYGVRGVKGVLRAIAIFIAYMLVYITAYAGSMTSALFSEAPPRIVSDKAWARDQAAAAARAKLETTRAGATGEPVRE